MNLEVQEKKFSFKRFLASMRHSIDGIISAYKNEQSLWIHGVCSIIAIIISVWLFTQWPYSSSYRRNNKCNNKCQPKI